MAGGRGPLSMALMRLRMTSQILYSRDTTAALHRSQPALTLAKRIGTTPPAASTSPWHLDTVANWAAAFQEECSRVRGWYAFQENLAAPRNDHHDAAAKESTCMSKAAKFGGPEVTEFQTRSPMSDMLLSGSNPALRRKSEFHGLCFSTLAAGLAKQRKHTKRHDVARVT
eukprot:2473077-Rhodomonas_salina.1